MGGATGSGEEGPRGWQPSAGGPPGPGVTTVHFCELWNKDAVPVRARGVLALLAGVSQPGGRLPQTPPIEGAALASEMSTSVYAPDVCSLRVPRCARHVLCVPVAC